MRLNSEKGSMEKFRKKVKPIRKRIRKVRKRFINKKNLTKIIMVLSALALIAGYILPYLN